MDLHMYHIWFKKLNINLAMGFSLKKKKSVAASLLELQIV